MVLLSEAYRLRTVFECQAEGGITDSGSEAQ